MAIGCEMSEVEAIGGFDFESCEKENRGEQKRVYIVDRLCEGEGS